MLRLMIVDDECEIRNGLKNYFPWNDVGFEVAADFGDGEDALRYARSEAVDAILTDIRMSGMDGIAFIREIRKTYPQMPIVVLSGYRDFEYARQAMQMDVKYYLVKPTKYKQLTEVFSQIRDALEAQQEKKAPAAEEPEGRTDGREDNPVIRKATRYIQDHFATASLESTAKHVRMNAYYFSSYFHQQTGSKFSDYLLCVRMREAARLLLETELPISEIGVRAGYATPNSFARSFRQFYQLAPKEYRKLNSKME